MISYEDFIKLAAPTDVELLTLLAIGERASTTDIEEAKKYNETMDRLLGAGVLLRGGYFKEPREDVVWYVFEGRIDPKVATYLSRATKERIQFREAPVPAAEVPTPP